MSEEELVSIWGRLWGMSSDAALAFQSAGCNETNFSSEQCQKLYNEQLYHLAHLFCPKQYIAHVECLDANPDDSDESRCNNFLLPIEDCLESRFKNWQAKPESINKFSESVEKTETVCMPQLESLYKCMASEQDCDDQVLEMKLCSWKLIDSGEVEKIRKCLKGLKGKDAVLMVEDGGECNGVWKTAERTWIKERLASWTSIGVPVKDWQDVVEKSRRI